MRKAEHARPFLLSVTLSLSLVECNESETERHDDAAREKNTCDQWEKSASPHPLYCFGNFFNHTRKNCKVARATYGNIPHTFIQI